MPTLIAPDDALLRRFLLGTLSPAEAQAVERWLEANPDASVRLRSLSAHDTVTDAIGAEANTDSGDTAVRTALPKPALPITVGSYRVVRELGRGGMGVVLEAEDSHLKRRVAIKLIAAEFAGSGQARDRFLREAQAVARIDHPNVVPVHHVGEHDGQLYLVMPLLKGETLGERLRREKKLTASEVMRIGREVAAGLAAAHAVGLIHRDVKPANIWLDADTGRARVLDFGLAKPLDQSADDGLTGAGAVMGTPHYMSPQQANGEPLDPRTDLFSLGAVLHHATTGERPFDGPTTFAVLYAVVNDAPKSLDALSAALPARVAAVVRELLEKRPDARPQSAAEVIERLAEPPPVAARTESPTGYAGDTKPSRRVRAVGLVAGALLVAAAVAAVVVIVRDKNGNEVARVEVPEGGSVAVQPLPKTPTSVQPTPTPPAGAPAAADADTDRRATEKVLALGGKVQVQVNGKGVGVLNADELPKGPIRLTRVDLSNRPSVTDDEVEFLKGCKNLEVVGLHIPLITDAGVSYLKDSAHLVELNIRGTKITDAGVAHLKSCTKLNNLSLGATNVTDAGLAHLRGCKHLTRLILDNTPVTDAGVEHLKALDQLTVLELQGAQVTAAGVADLAKALPACRIRWAGGVIVPKK